MVRKVVVLILLLPGIASAEWNVVGYAGAWTRVKAQRFELFGFRSSPASTVTPALGAGGGKTIWKVRLDGSLLYTRTGETNTIIGFAREVTETVNGSTLAAEGGAGWPLLKLAGFQSFARAGYGVSRIRVPTQIAIEDNRRFWTYGIAATRPFRSRYLIRIDLATFITRAKKFPRHWAGTTSSCLAGSVCASSAAGLCGCGERVQFELSKIGEWFGLRGFPSFAKEGWLRIKKKPRSLIGADGVVVSSHRLSKSFGMNKR